jgi:hypothetical protein
MTTHTTTGNAARTQEAADLVEHWETDDKRFFVNFMCGYDPDAVVRFEECRRRIADLADGRTA